MIVAVLLPCDHSVLFLRRSLSIFALLLDAFAYSQPILNINFRNSGKILEKYKKMGFKNYFEGLLAIYDSSYGCEAIKNRLRD